MNMPGPAARTLRVLVVEDNAINQAVAVRLLEKAGYEVQVAENGREALAAVEQQRFDLVLMDLQMPEMDGLDATRTIRQRERATGQHLCIIALTAHAMKGDREQCLAAGMDGYVAKPIQKAELFKAIEEQMALVNRPSGEGEPRGAAPASASTALTETFDRAAALEHLDGDTELLAEGAGMFLEKCPALVSAVQQAVKGNDSRALMCAAHTLKGSLTTFAAGPSLEAAASLERMGRQGDLSRANEICRELEAAVEQLKPALAKLRRELMLQ